MDFQNVDGIVYSSYLNYFYLWVMSSLANKNTQRE